MFLLEAPRFCANLHHRQVGGVVDEQGRFADLAHPPGEARPVVVGHATRTHVTELDLRLGGEQPHDDLGLAHLEGEHDGSHAVLDRAGPQEVHAERGVVGGHHRPPGEIQVLAVDLDAPHRYGLDGTDGDDAPLPRHRRTGLLVRLGLAGEDEHVVVGGESHRRPGGGAGVAEAGQQLGDVVPQAGAVRLESHGPVVLDVAAGVEQTGEQFTPLLFRRPLVGAGDVRAERHEFLGESALALHPHVHVGIGRRATEPGAESERGDGQLGDGQVQRSDVADDVAGGE